MFKIAFLDRDGTLNIDKNYIHKWVDFEWIPGAQEFIYKLKQNGYLIYVISNQAGIAKGLYTKKDVMTLFKLMNRDIYQSYKIKLDGIRFCPHHPDISGICQCRKPSTKLLKDVINQYKNIDLNKSFMVGDHIGDYEVGKKVNIRSFLLQHPFGHNHPNDSVPKDQIISNLMEIIL